MKITRIIFSTYYKNLEHLTQTQVYPLDNKNSLARTQPNTYKQEEGEEMMRDQSDICGSIYNKRSLYYFHNRIL